jgi:predicted metalloprotease with PDZ domain
MLNASTTAAAASSTARARRWSRRAATCRASPTAQRRRRDRGRRGRRPSEGYTDLLGLIAHEYFHAWNVKRLKPRDFAPLDYTRENYTELLWFFEGFTSYYDDLLLLRAGLIDAPRYLQLVAKTMTAVPARRARSCRASPRRASTPGSSTTAATRTRRTRRSATTPRARSSRSRST